MADQLLRKWQVKSDTNQSKIITKETQSRASSRTRAPPLHASNCTPSPPSHTLLSLLLTVSPCLHPIPLAPLPWWRALHGTEISCHHHRAEQQATFSHRAFLSSQIQSSDTHRVQTQAVVTRATQSYCHERNQTALS